MARSPLFVVIEPTGADAQQPARRIAWACDSGAGTAARPPFAIAVARIAALAERHPLHLADPLFDAPRLEAAFAAAGDSDVPEAQDWLNALASFGQARKLAAILEAAEARAGAANPAARLLEAWREAAARAAKI
jgi:hypothetical protein